jgi:hypothetical protein
MQTTGAVNAVNAITTANAFIALLYTRCVVLPVGT